MSHPQGKLSWNVAVDKDLVSGDPKLTSFSGMVKKRNPTYLILGFYSVTKKYNPICSIINCIKY